MTEKVLQKVAQELKLTILEMNHKAGSSHTGGSYSCAEIVTVLYEKYMNINPDNPRFEQRDRFVLSKGHATPTLYATLARKGYFDSIELSSLRQTGSILQGDPLDSTFYQCVKGMVSCLPAIKQGGTIISSAGCSEGVGSPHYVDTMSKYEADWKSFLKDIKGGLFIKDQWQYQMHGRVLAKVGQENLLFVTDGLKQDVLNNLSVNGTFADNVQEKVQALVAQF